MRQEIQKFKSLSIKILENIKVSIFVNPEPFGVYLQLPKMNVSRFAISLSKIAFFKRAWQILKVLSRP